MSEKEDDVVFGGSLPEDEPTESKKGIPKIKLPKTDSTVKRDIAFVQKKIAELEIAISEVQENIQKIDFSGLEDLKQRVEDIEDLTMVENAGVIELKKFLVEIKEKTQSSIPPELDEKINNLEQKINTLAIPTAPVELDEKINNLEQKIASLSGTEVVTPDISGLKGLEESLQMTKNEFQNRLNEVNYALTDLENRTGKGVDAESLKAEIKNYIIPLIPQLPDFNVIKKRLEDSIETIEMDIESYKKELGRIKQDVEEKVNAPLQSKLLKELEDTKNESLIINSKVDAIDNFVKELSKDVSEVRPLVHRLDSKVVSLEGLADVEKSIDEKLDEFRDVLKTAETLKESSNSFKELDVVLSRFRDIEKKLVEMKNFVDEFEKSKEDVLTSKWRTDYKKLIEDMNRKFEKLRRELEVRIVEGKHDGVDLSEINRNVSSIQETVSSLNKKLEKAETVISSMENDMSVFQGNLMSLEQRNSNLTFSIEELDNAIGKQPKSEMGELVNRIESLEIILDNRIKEVERKLEATSASTDFYGHMSEIVNRLVFLESRLAAMEGMIQDNRYAPIVVE